MSTTTQADIHKLPMFTIATVGNIRLMRVPGGWGFQILDTQMAPVPNTQGFPQLIQQTIPGSMMFVPLNDASLKDLLAHVAPEDGGLSAPSLNVVTPINPKGDPNGPEG